MSIRSLRPTPKAELTAAIADTPSMPLRLLALLLLLILLPSAALAQQSPSDDLVPQRSVDIGPQLPTWDASAHAWRDAQAHVPASGPAPDGSLPVGAGSASITVTATVLPSRSVEFKADGSMSVLGNTLGPSWWSFTREGKQVAPDREIWNRVAQCMRDVQRERGEICRLR
jgi:hypothetical protein